MPIQSIDRAPSYRKSSVKLSKLWEDLQIHHDVNLIFTEPALNPAECPSLPIMEADAERPDYLSLVDGYHRTAGMLRWCAANGVHPHSVLIEVAVTDDWDLIQAIDGGNDIKEQAAVDRVLELAAA